jgi:hypothetical protein
MSAEKSLELPKASVKRIMKLSEEVSNVSAVNNFHQQFMMDIYFE